MSKYSDIIERLEKATGPDREIDCLIWAGENMMTTEFRNSWLIASNMTREVTLGYIDPGKKSRNFSSTVKNEVPRYTSSIDAAIALVERMLPGWAKGFDSGAKTTIAFVDHNDYADRFLGVRHTAEAKSVPIAILLALFHAIEAKESGE